MIKLFLIFLFTLSVISGEVRDYPNFYQCDSQWAYDKLGSSSTICKVGCLMTSVSMGMNALGIKIDGKSVDPEVLNEWMMDNNGYSGNLFIWSSIEKCSKLEYEGKTTSFSTMQKRIEAGDIVIIKLSSRSHWLLGTHTSGSYIYVNDPGSKTTGYTKLKSSEISQAAIYDASDYPLSGSSSSSSSSSSSATYATATANVNIRKSKCGTKMFKATKGTSYKMYSSDVGTCWGHTWIKIKTSSGTGYAAATYFDW